jgi:hypothetical protein
MSDRDADADLLAGYFPEETLCRELNESPRTARLRRQRGEGPPYVRIGRKILYPIEGFRLWLKRREIDPSRRMQRRGTRAQTGEAF